MDFELNKAQQLHLFAFVHFLRFDNICTVMSFIFMFVDIISGRVKRVNYY